MRTQGPGQSALLLLDVIDLLHKETVDYAIIGAMAASVHGVVRASLDADALLSLTVQKLGEIEKTFANSGFRTELRRGDYDDPIAALLEIRDVHDNRVDLLVGLRGLEPAAFSRAIEITFQGVRVRIIGLEDFIAMKLFAGSPRDIDDAQGAIASAKKSLDRDLLARLAAGFGHSTVQNLEKILPS